VQYLDSVEEFSSDVTIEEIRDFFFVAGGGLKLNGVGEVLLKNFGCSGNVYELVGAQRLLPSSKNRDTEEINVTKVNKNVAVTAPASNTSEKLGENPITAIDQEKLKKAEEYLQLVANNRIVAYNNFQKVSGNHLLTSIIVVLLCIIATCWIAYTIPEFPLSQYDSFPTRLPIVVAFITIASSFGLVAMFHS